MTILNPFFKSSQGALWTQLVFLSLLITGCSHLWSFKEPKTAHLYRKMALSYLAGNNSPQAFATLKVANELNPRNSSLHNIYGLAYLSIDKPQKAERSFIKSLQLDPQNTEARNNYISILIQNKNYSKALKLSQKSVEDLSYPYREQSILNLGRSHYYVKNYNKALVFLNKARSLKPNVCTTSIYLSRVLQKTKPSKQSLQHTNKSWKETQKICKSIDITDEANYYLGINHHRLSQRSESKNFLLKVIESKNKKNTYYNKALKIYLKL